METFISELFISCVPYSITTSFKLAHRSLKSITHTSQPWSTPYPKKEEILTMGDCQPATVINLLLSSPIIQNSYTFFTAWKAKKVLLITLTMALSYWSVTLSHDSVTVSQREQHQSLLILLFTPVLSLLWPVIMSSVKDTGSIYFVNS